MKGTNILASLALYVGLIAVIYDKDIYVTKVVYGTSSHGYGRFGSGQRPNPYGPDFDYRRTPSGGKVVGSG